MLCGAFTGSRISWLKSKELEVLLRWKGVPVLAMGNRRIQLFKRKMAEMDEADAGDGETPPLPPPPYR
jgi:hypothetical protein